MREMQGSGEAKELPPVSLNFTKYCSIINIIHDPERSEGQVE